eukprot:m.444926 g.444926  ORF g.444926 m.444926 type:complete len:177 (+) comp19166_c0_seq1:96-626(+)
MDYYKMDQQPLLQKARKPTLPEVSYSLRKSVAVVGIIFGLAATIVFSGLLPQFKNPWASGLGAGSGIVAAVTLWNHSRYQAAEQAGTFPTSHSLLFRLFAIISGSLGMAGFLGFLFVGLYNLEELTGRSPYICAIWGFALAKWSILMLLYTNDYEKRREIRKQLAPPSDSHLTSYA